MSKKYAIGLNISHDPAVSLIIDGKIIAAAEEEKMRGIKSVNKFPYLSLKFILEHIAHGSTVDIYIGFINLTEIFANHSNLNKFFELDHSKLAFLKNDLLRVLTWQTTDKEKIRISFENNLKKITKNVRPDVKLNCIQYIDHHLSHAASAAYPSTFESALILTMDGKGDGKSGSIYSFENGELHDIAHLTEFQSLGQIYANATEIIGFKSKRHEGKVTGLSARGNPEIFKNFLKTIYGSPEQFIENGSLLYTKLPKCLRISFFKLNKQHFSITFMKDFIIFHLLPKNLKKIAIGRIIGKNAMSDFRKVNNLSKEDISAGVQAYVEEAALIFLRKNLNTQKFQNICLAGGLFANVRINQKILEIQGIREIYVQPAMNDAGAGLGAALYRKHETLVNFESHNLDQTVFLGPSFSLNTFKSVCEDQKKALSQDLADPKFLAKLILDGQIVARFTGKLEWGPRALGHRSILATAFDDSINEILNRNLGRNDFMPFAPLIIEDDAEKLLKNFMTGVTYSDNMTVTLEIKEIYRADLPSIVHVDGTARPQIIYKKYDLFLYNILKEIRNLTGHGVAINTSFNLHETPIINNPYTALEILNSQKIDYLLFEDRLVI